jgi:hypothetical protein
MSDLGRIGLGVLVAVSTLAVLIFGAQRYMEQRRFGQEIEELRDELYRARVSSDRCRSSLATSEASLRDLTRRIAVMRSQVDSFEALGGGRVPAEQYDTYLGVFDTYNDSVAAWEIRSERLLNAEVACREVIEEHNAISDSIQYRLQDAGIRD